MSSHESVAIVGAGAIGTALAHAFSRAAVPVAAVASRRPERAQALARAIGATAVAVADAGAAAPVVLLTVSDSAIDEVARAVRSGPTALVAHASGSRSVEPLAAAAARGSAVGGFHPLAAVARGAALQGRSAAELAAAFSGAAFAIEGDDAVWERLSALARAVGGTPFRIAAADKTQYHLGASMLAAFSAGLSQVAWEQLRRAGADAATASRGVAHLLKTVAENVASVPTPAHALTGPVARGDAAGVVRQARAAGALPPEAQALYRVHVAHNVVLARSAGTIDDGAAGAMLSALAALDRSFTEPERDGPDQRT